LDETKIGDISRNWMISSSLRRIWRREEPLIDQRLASPFGTLGVRRMYATYALPGEVSEKHFPQMRRAKS
jgi:hypothetical protein